MAICQLSLNKQYNNTNKLLQKLLRNSSRYFIVKQLFGVLKETTDELMYGLVFEPHVLILLFFLFPSAPPSHVGQIVSS